MSRISENIPRAAFELIRDRIAEIIYSELLNQLYTYGDYHLDAVVTVEEMSPEDKVRLPLVNVCLSEATYNNKDYSGNVKASPYQYFVDCYVNAAASSSKSGDTYAAQKLHRLMAAVRYILENPIFKTLGYSAPFIQRVYVSNFKIGNKSKNDALSSIVGRFFFNVEVNENVKLLNANMIDNYKTSVRLNNSSEGYFWTKNDGY